MMRHLLIRSRLEYKSIQVIISFSQSITDVCQTGKFMNNLDPLFFPKSVAIVGASATEEKLGGIVLKNLLRMKGRVYPINPNYRELMGLKAYPSIRDLPETVDLSIIMRPAVEVAELLRQHTRKADLH
jgi:acyl-CoA synthetase (NDP forming)